MVGRSEERARMVDCLRAANAGHGATLVVSGARGIGKTHLLRHWTELASAAGALALNGAGDNLEGALPYWPWVAITRQLISRLAPEAETLVQSLQQILPEFPGQPELHDSQQRFQLFDSFARVVEAVSRELPTLICIDDLDLADGPSKVLAQVLATRSASLRMVLVIAVTDGWTQDPTLTQLTHNAQHVPLRGLSTAEVHQLLGASAIDVSGAEAICKHSGGNPLYARQLAPLWRHGHRDSLLPLPITLQQAVSSTLRDLPENLADLVGGAAAVGEAFSPALLATALNRSVDEVDADLQRALGLSLVQRATRPVGHYRLQHGLLREVAYQALNPEQRIAIHERVLRTLLAQAKRGEVARCEVLAHHSLRASVTSRLRHGIEFGLQAADQAFRRGAFDRCASHCSRLLEAMALGDVAHPARRQVELRLASALGRLGQLDQAAAAYAAAILDPSQRTLRPALQESELRALHASFESLTERLPDVVATMYELLFAAHPETRAMFRQRRPDVQARMVADTLTAVLEHFEDPPWLAETLFAMGARHLEYGVQDVMYAWVGDALLAALARHVAADFTPQLERIWRRAYDEICRLMLEAARVSQSVVSASRLPLPPASMT